MVRIDRKKIHVVIPGPDGTSRTISCSVRGRFFETQDDDPESRPVAVGDYVRVILDEEGGASQGTGSEVGAPALQGTPETQGTIELIHPRKSRIARPRPRSPENWQVIAANVDLLVIVTSLKQPGPKPGLIDRLLVMAESEKIEPLIVLNKTDLTTLAEADEFAAPYRALGYGVLATSAKDQRGIAELRDAMRGRTAMLLGHSGVGKSSLLMALDPAVAARIGELVAQGTKMVRGAHTTTSASLHRLGFGADLVDTPGVREFGLPPMEPHDLAHWFRDLAPFIPQCKYATCTHDHEPSCAVKAAAASKLIREERYATYLKLLAELRGGGQRMQRHDSY